MNASQIMEIELKLLVAPEHIARLRRHPLVRAGALGKPVNRRLFAEYFDTEDFALRRAGVALRLRREGPRVVQTVKLVGQVDGGLHQRPEWEVEVHDGQLDFAVMMQAGWCKPLCDPGLQRRLRPIFVTQFRRTTRILEPTPGSVMELCLDEGEIIAGNRTSPISEIEFELRSGTRSALYNLAIALDLSVPLKLEQRSKAERGYNLLRGATTSPARAIKAAPIELAPKISVEVAFSRVVFDCLAHLQANEAGMIARQGPEYLHQMRVAVRRMRSAFGIFRPALPGAALPLHAAELRWLGQILGPARDWDIFTTITLPEIITQFPDHAGISRVREFAAQARAAAGEKAIEAVTSRRYQRSLLLLSAWLTSLLDAASTASIASASIAGVAAKAGAIATSAGSANAATASLPGPGPKAGSASPAADSKTLREFAHQVLSKRHKRVRQRGRKLPRLGVDERHQVRIAVKKLRYASEFFSSLYSKSPVRKYTMALAALQEVLGALNDAATASALLSFEPVVETTEQRPAVGHSKETGTNAAKHEAVGIIAGFSAAQAKATLSTLDKRFNAFHRVQAFW